MAREWTDGQLDAINARGGALLVSAAAGSGKTAVLVERVIQKICDEKNPTELDRLLVVTYTNAAANEMKERIGEALAEKLSADPRNPLLLRQQARLLRANISTIDSFCKNLVREYFYLLDISSDFRIGDKSELELLKNEALTRTLNKFYNSKDPNFYLLAESFSSSKNDDNIEEIVLRIYDFLRTHPFGEKWIRRMLQNYDSDKNISDTVWGKTVLDYTRGAIDYAVSLYEQALPLAHSEPAFVDNIGNHINLCIAMLRGIQERLNSGADWDSIRAAVLNCNIPGFPTPKGYAAHPTKQAIHAKHTAAAEIVNKKLRPLFLFDSEQARDQLIKLRPVIEQMFLCVSDFTEEYGKIKREKNIADFNDLEHWTLRLLTEETEDSYEISELSKQIAARFDEVMVDEYQDANEVQDTIYRALSGDNERLFVVGDVKQSIYAFRQAMPEIFIERKNRSARYDRDNAVFPAAVILDRNFRSRREITDTVNFVFRHLMSETVGDMRYSDDEELKAGAPYDEIDSPCVDFTIIDSEKCNTTDIVAEASAMAEKILKMMSDNVTVSDKGGIRELRYSDIAVLMRTLKENAQAYVSVFNAYGIPVTCEKTQNFFEIYEVRALLDLLRVISNPLLDIPLLAVLMSPLYGFTSDDIAKIRVISRGTSLYTALLVAADIQIDCQERIKSFLEQIADLRTYSATLGIRELIAHIFEVTGFSAVITAGRQNYSADKNLDKFCEYAAAFEKNGRRGLSSFLNYMDKLSESSADLGGAADAHPEDANTVKIISIHKSKGLEYPVCILGNTSKRFNTRDLSQKVLIHSRMGIASKLRIREPSSYRPTLMHRALTLELRRGLLSEELRLLYVALTRARERLILPVSVNDSEKALISAGAKIIDSSIPPFNVLEASGFSTWLLMCALLHPDAHSLRYIARLEDYRIEGGDIPRWNFEIITSLSGADDAKNAEKSMPENDIALTDEDLLTTLRRYSGFEYPLKAIENLPVKVTASEIAHRESDLKFKTTLSSPAFLKKEKITAAQKGTAVHKFLQLCDFKLARADLNAEIERLHSCGRLSRAEADAVREKNPAAFFSSELALEAINSSEVFREYTFMVSIDAKLIEPNIAPKHENRQVLMQGSVDLAFLRNDGSLLIADYKTDRVSHIEELSKRYSMQLALYKNAMEQSTGLRVSKCVLYSVYLGESLEITV